MTGGPAHLVKCSLPAAGLGDFAVPSPILAERLSINRGRHKPAARYRGQAAYRAATLGVIIPQIQKIYRL